MTFDADAAYQAVAARDARFDGQLFVGVTSTGIYCRPICRVRTPMRRNCRFFTSPAQAEAASFRPCLKCRPEIAPGPGLPWTVMDASSTLARQAALALDAGTAHAEPIGVAQLAERLGVSERHLRRIFAAVHGVSPLQYMQTRRLLLAKQLLTDTQLPVAQIALASGFKSLRRFNAAFVGNYRMNPGRLRRALREGVARDSLPDDGTVRVTLGYREPYDIDALLRFIALRAIPGVEAVEGRRIRRTLRGATIAPAAGWIEAEFMPRAPQVRVRFAPELAGASAAVIGAVRRWLDLDAAPHAIDAALVELPGNPGVRLPGSIDGFELAVRAILGQQISVVRARALAGHIVERFGATLPTPWSGIDRTFPAPQTLAAAPPERIAELGIIRVRAGAIIALAQQWPALIALLQPPAQPEPLIERLCQLPGIGPWTAHYIAMRVLGWPDALLPNDVAVLRAMRLLFETSSQREAELRAQPWQPWRSYAVLRLWNSLEKTP